MLGELHVLKWPSVACQGFSCALLGTDNVCISQSAVVLRTTLEERACRSACDVRRLSRSSIQQVDGITRSAFTTCCSAQLKLLLDAERAVLQNSHDLCCRSALFLWAPCSQHPGRAFFARRFCGAMRSMFPRGCCFGADSLGRHSRGEGPRRPKLTLHLSSFFHVSSRERPLHKFAHLSSPLPTDPWNSVGSPQAFVSRQIAQLAERVSVLVASLQRRCDEDKEECAVIVMPLCHALSSRFCHATTL